MKSGAERAENRSGLLNEISPGNVLVPQSHAAIVVEHIRKEQPIAPIGGTAIAMDHIGDLSPIGQLLTGVCWADHMRSCS
jgi:hypothetical protein